MPPINKKSLARDENVRVNELGQAWHESGKLSPEKLFRYRSIVRSLPLEKVSLPGFCAREILTSFAFHERIFLQFCPTCHFDEKVLKPLLETGQVIPVMLGNYNYYKVSVLREILRYPHMSHPEFWLYQQSEVGARHDLICGHCLEERFVKELLKDFPAKSDDPVVRAAQSFRRNLFPYPKTDGDLIEQFCAAVIARNLDKVKQLAKMSSILRQLRTAEIFKASPALDFEDFETARKLGLALQPKGALPSIEHLVADNLEINIPTGMPPEKYIEIVMPHKSRLMKIVREIAENSHANDGNVSLSKLVSEIGAINEQIRRAQKTRRFAALQASAGLVSTSPVLFVSLLAAGGMGLCSSMLGCSPGVTATLSGAATATAGGAKLLAKAMKTKWDGRVVAYKDRVLQDLRQQMSGFMATYLQMDVRSVHVWQVRKDLETAKQSKK